MYSHSYTHICIYSHSYIFIYVCIHIYVYMNENSILNTQTPVSPFVWAWNPYQSCGLGELGACPLCLPHTPCLSLCRTWQRKRGKLLQSQVQGLAAKAACGAGGQSRTLAPGRQPSSTVEKRLGTKEASRQASRLLLPCRSSAEEPDLRASLGQVLTWPQEAVKGP